MASNSTISSEISDFTIKFKLILQYNNKKKFSSLPQEKKARVARS